MICIAQVGSTEARWDYRGVCPLHPGKLRNLGGSRQSLLSLPRSAAQGRLVRMVVRPAPWPGSVRPPGDLLLLLFMGWKIQGHSFLGEEWKSVE